MVKCFAVLVGLFVGAGQPELVQEVVGPVKPGMERPSQPVRGGQSSIHDDVSAGGLVVITGHHFISEPVIVPDDTRVVLDDNAAIYAAAEMDALFVLDGVEDVSITASGLVRFYGEGLAGSAILMHDVTDCAVNFIVGDGLLGDVVVLDNARFSSVNGVWAFQVGGVAVNLLEGREVSIFNVQTPTTTALKVAPVDDKDVIGCMAAGIHGGTSESPTLVVDVTNAGSFSLDVTQLRGQSAGVAAHLTCTNADATGHLHVRDYRGKVVADWVGAVLDFNR